MKRMRVKFLAVSGSVLSVLLLLGGALLIKIAGISDIPQAGFPGALLGGRYFLIIQGVVVGVASTCLGSPAVEGGLHKTRYFA